MGQDKLSTGKAEEAELICSGVLLEVLPATSEGGVTKSVVVKPASECRGSEASEDPGLMPNKAVSVVCARHECTPMAKRQTQNKTNFIQKATLNSILGV